MHINVLYKITEKIMLFDLDLKITEQKNHSERRNTSQKELNVMVLPRTFSKVAIIFKEIKLAHPS